MLRNGIVFSIKLIHTVLFALISACVLDVFVSGVRGQPRRRTGSAIVVVLIEMIVFAANRWRCPLTRLAEHLGADSGRVTDIFLPRWFADRIPQIYTPLFITGLLGLLWHHQAVNLERSDQIERSGLFTERALTACP